MSRAAAERGVSEAPVHREVLSKRLSRERLVGDNLNTVSDDRPTERGSQRQQLFAVTERCFTVSV